LVVLLERLSAGEYLLARLARVLTRVQLHVSL
jgi:hypothetical protein